MDIENEIEHLISRNFSTIFCDIDGTLIYQPTPKRDFFKELEEVVKFGHLLPGAAEKLNQWKNEGNKIVLTTARPEILRELTEFELDVLDLKYDLLIMDCGTGPRLLINNFQPNSTVPLARSANVDVNTGIADVEI